MIRLTNTLRILLASLALLALATFSGCFERFTQREPHGSHASESPAEQAEHGHDDRDQHGEHAAGETQRGKEAEEEHAAHGDEPDGHDEHNHDEHGHDEGGHAGHHHAELIALTPEQLKEFGVKVSTATGGKLDEYLTLPGEVAVNADTVGHVLPKLPGVVKQVRRNIGDTVKAGDLLAVVESRELADAKAAYLAVRERQAIAEATQERERHLFAQGVSPEQDYINATSAVREVQIQVRAAEQSLHALAISEAQIVKLVASPHDSLTRYEVYAPLGGRILEKHVSLGEMVSPDDELFLIADLSSVWVNLSVSQKDLPRVKEGQIVRIRFSPSVAGTAAGPAAAAQVSGVPDAVAKIKYIDALVAEDTRAAAARVVLPNPSGVWRPGMFVSGLLTSGSAQTAVLIPLTAVINFEGQPTVFIEDDNGFEPRTVTLGRQSATHAEVLSGLATGEHYVSAGAYLVKAELGKSEASHEH